MAERDVELGHVGIDVILQDLLKYDGVEVQNPRDKRLGSIFMVPKVYRDVSPHSFTPRVVSIGPLHHEDEHLKGFEVHKATYVHNLLHNLLSPLDSTPEQILKECVMRVSGSIDRIKACYVGMKTYPDSSELVKMMVTDACFILAFLSEPDPDYSSFGTMELLYPHIVLDMVFIENQIPFFVLQDIFDCTFSKHCQVPLTLSEIIFQLAQNWRLFEEELVMDNSSISSTHDHILGFIHKSFQHPYLNSSSHNGMLKTHSVVELDRSGVRVRPFSKKLDAKWRMDMELELSSFLCFPLSWGKPTLKMPVLRLYDETESVIRNLIIHEHSSRIQTCITSYMHALDKLIDTPEDVAKLVKSQVLVNHLGSDEKAANLINNILKEVPVNDFYYEDEWEILDKYYTAKWPKFIAVLRRTYFNNPWSIIAVIAAMVLFILTVIQTVSSVKAT